MMSSLGCKVSLLLSLVIPSYFLVAQQYDSSACVIKYPRRQSEKDTRNDYPIELLTAALKVTAKEYGPCKLLGVGPMNQKRAIKSVVDSTIDIAWVPATARTNALLSPIKVPLRKGLLGWRLLLVNESELAEFSEVNTLDDLRQFKTGFGADWQDLPVMQKNFDTVVLTNTYEQLFKLLHNRRFDFFSRGLHEAWDEIEYHKADDYQFAVLDHIMLRYKAVDLFYVNKQNKQLHKRLSKGMNQIIIDGTFNDLFYSYYSNYIDTAHINLKTVIELENPNFPNDIAFKDPQLWFQLTDYRAKN